MIRSSRAASLLAFLLLAHAGSLAAQTDTPAGHPADKSFDIRLGNDSVRVELLGSDAVHVQFRANGVATPTSMVIDPARVPASASAAMQVADTTTQQLDSPTLHVSWDPHAGELRITDADHHLLLSQRDLFDLHEGRLRLTHAAGQPMYGIGGYDAFEQAGGLLRSGQQIANAGEQGHAGAPFVWTTAGYGVLLNSDGAQFALDDTHIDAAAGGNLDYYVLTGRPATIFRALAEISGHAPLFPKWASGFTNSQWGIDQKELLSLVDTYRGKHIPIDNFTLDFDWKAWGEDYGEFRWNPVKFPDGPNGKLKQQLDRRGLHLTGIMKPRVHVDTVEGRDATAHALWVAGEAASDDYFSHKPVRDIDFNQAAARAWFFNDTLKQSFDTGIVGWWNDEADYTGSNTQFTNMQRALYDGQRAHSPLRVWSVNRNFYLGAQRYAYGLWSGDIATGFASMAAQRQRMLSAVDVGAMQWGMDGGGFQGHPSDENYARWIEFGAFTPIFRVHGTFGEKRQPWTYRPIAEQAATAAIRLRYALVPYIYSYAQRLHADGVGLVRPLLFDWPDDAHVRDDVDAWLFGDWLLVSPVVAQGQTAKDIYLPAGRWTDWFSGKVYAGGQTIHRAIDSTHWQDIPLFVRQGAIIPMQPPMDYVDQHPLTELAVELFPDDRRSTFDYYDDDGASYDYEHGQFFQQSLSLQRQGEAVNIDIDAATGSYKPALAFYLLKVHGVAASAVSMDGHTLGPLRHGDGHDGDEGWTTGHDRFGPITTVRLAAGREHHLVLHGRPILRAGLMSLRSPRCSAVVVRRWCVAQRLTGGQVKPRAAAWRPQRNKPRGRVCLPPGPRHHSVVYGRTLPHSSLACAQTAHGAGYGETLDRL